MSTPPAARGGGSRPPGWLRLRWRYLAGVIAVLAAAGAFLFWGPVGIGSGPLTMGAWDTTGWADVSLTPVGTIIPVLNAGRATAVIDSVRLVGDTRYPAPRLLGLELLTSGRCGGVWPARQAGTGFVLVGCGGTDDGPVTGRPYGRTGRVSFGYPAAAELAPPKAGGCWVLSAVVVHYHVGIRHYEATDPDGLVVCSAQAALSAATNAAIAAEPG